MTSRTLGRSGSRGSTGSFLVQGLVATALAVIANLVVFLLLRGPLGIDLQVAQPGQALEDLGAAPVVIATLLPCLLAVGLALALRRRSWGPTALAVTGVVVALLSLASPLMLDVSTAVKVGLSVLHLVPAAVIVPALVRAMRSSR